MQDLLPAKYYQLFPDITVLQMDTSREGHIISGYCSEAFTLP